MAELSPNIVINNENVNKNVNENNNSGSGGDDTCSVICCFVLGCCIPCVWTINCCLNRNSQIPNTRCWATTGCVLEIIRFFPLVAAIIVLICLFAGVGVFAGIITGETKQELYDICAENCKNKYSEIVNEGKALKSCINDCYNTYLS